MNRNLAMSLFFGLGTVVLFPACTSASSVCETICECEHCNKYRELSQCRIMERTEARADAYGCSEQNTAVLTCILAKGRCDETKATYDLTGPGKCVQQSQGMSCTSVTDCSGFNPQCTNGECTEGSCANSGNFCNADNDCSGDVVSLCATEEEALAKCISDASAKDD